MIQGVRKSEPVSPSVYQFGTPCPISNSVKRNSDSSGTYHRNRSSNKPQKGQIKLLLNTTSISCKTLERTSVIFWNEKYVLCFSFYFRSLILNVHFDVKMDKKYNWRQKMLGNFSLAPGQNVSIQSIQKLNTSNVHVWRLKRMIRKNKNEL